MSTRNYHFRFYAYSEQLQWHYTSRANLTERSINKKHRPAVSSKFAYPAPVVIIWNTVLHYYIFNTYLQFFKFCELYKRTVFINFINYYSEAAFFTCYAFSFCIFVMGLMMVTIISRNMSAYIWLYLQNKVVFW